MSLQWPTQAIQQALAPVWPGLRVEVLPSLPSTNTELMQRLRAGQAEPVLLLAEQQTAGRGRLGRQWLSSQRPEAGASLTFSLGVPLRCADWSGLSLAVGVALAQSLHPEIGLKWPNDLWWQGRKLGGILIETTELDGLRHGVIGVGLNIAPQQAAALSTPAACLQELLPQLSAPAALAQIAQPLCLALRQFEQAGFEQFQTAFQARDVLLNRPVQLSDGSCGTARGVDERGALRLDTPGGLRLVQGAEVSVRPEAVTGGV